MFLIGFVSWWYKSGWLACAARVRDSLARAYDLFSFDLLLKTLFAPFRQISAEKVSGPINIRMQAFFDRLLSRFIGAFMRTIILFIGLFVILISLIIGLARIIIWPILPLSPIIGCILAISGWIPWTI